MIKIPQRFYKTSLKQTTLNPLSTPSRIEKFEKSWEGQNKGASNKSKHTNFWKIKFKYIILFKFLSQFILKLNAYKVQFIFQITLTKNQNWSWKCVIWSIN